MHERLVESDAAYAAKWDAACESLLARLPRDIDHRTGYPIVFREMLTRGIYDRILEMAGPPTVIDVPEEYRAPEFMLGFRSSPFFSPLGPGNRVRGSLQAFHFCAGMRAAGSSGLTVTGSSDDPFVEAFYWLQAHDTAFRTAFDRATDPIREMVRTIDLTDPDQVSAITAAWRARLEKGGEDSVASRLERRAAEQLSAWLTSHCGQGADRQSGP